MNLFDRIMARGEYPYRSAGASQPQSYHCIPCDVMWIGAPFCWYCGAEAAL